MWPPTSFRNVEQESKLCSLELSRNASHFPRNPVVWRNFKRQSCTDSKRQRHCGGVHQSPGRSLTGVDAGSKSFVGRSFSEKHRFASKALSGEPERTCGQSLQENLAIRMAVTSKNFQTIRQNVGAPHFRQIRVRHNKSSEKIQQPVLRPTFLRSRCTGTAKLDGRKQFCKQPILPDSKGVKVVMPEKRYSNCYSTKVDSTGVVQAIVENVDFTSTTDSVKFKCDKTQFHSSGTAKKTEMENIRLESVWETTLCNLGWSESSVKYIKYAWSANTLDLYNRVVVNCAKYCERNNHEFPPVSTSVVADFLYSQCSRSQRPRSMINSTCAALKCLYDGYNKVNLCDSAYISTFKSALVKSTTKAPRLKTPIMPAKAFHDLFMKLDDNENLNIKFLRMKTVTLLALALMLRPSDIAPHAEMFDADDNICDAVVLSLDQIKFDGNGVKIRFFGIKNDTSRDGFEVTLQEATCKKLDPVGALKCYIDKTAVHRKAGGPVFIGLNKPYKHLSSNAISNILKDAINEAGLGGQGYSAKCFRPTGATLGVQSGCDPNVVRQLGRWKTESVFYSHYVHCNAPSDYFDKVIQS